VVHTVSDIDLERMKRLPKPKLPPEAQWTFQTKRVQAAELVWRASRRIQAAGKQVWVVADGAYAARAFVRLLLEHSITVVGRLRQDAVLFDVPPVVKHPGRGRPRKSGVNRLSLAKRAAHPPGWTEVTWTVYGKEVVKRTKTLLATHATFGGAIRMVIVKEDHGPQFFDGTALDATVREILEAFADHSPIEQDFHDVKEVWGAGQQPARNLWSNIGTWHLNLWLFTLTELWDWPRKTKQLTHRNDSPWDTADRRPSPADQRKSLQTQCLLNE
jgi:hypothetical protein